MEDKRHFALRKEDELALFSSLDDESVWVHEHFLDFLDDFFHCFCSQFPEDGHELEYWQVYLILVLLFEGGWKQR